MGLPHAPSSGGPPCGAVQSVMWMGRQNTIKSRFGIRRGDPVGMFTFVLCHAPQYSPVACSLRTNLFPMELSRKLHCAFRVCAFLFLSSAFWSQFVCDDIAYHVLFSTLQTTCYIELSSQTEWLKASYHIVNIVNIVAMRSAKIQKGLGSGYHCLRRFFFLFFLFFHKSKTSQAKQQAGLAAPCKAISKATSRRHCSMQNN